MGDSTCFMQPFSYASGLPNPDANQGNHNPIHSLGESVSFGRFMSESLAWEKWSSFSQKRYVEEAERYAQPGSVAQKKAFFEAHYKRIAAQKAAALLEQENATKDNNNNIPETEVEDRVCDDNGTTHDAQMTILIPHDSQVALLNSHVAVIEELKIKNQDVNNMVNTDSHDSAVKEVDLDIDNVVRADIVIENEPLPRSSINDESPSYSENVEDKNLVSGLEDCGTSHMEKPLLKHHHLKFTQDVPPSARKRNAVISSIRSSVFRKPSKVPPLPVKSIASVHPRKENFVTSRAKNKKPSMDPIDKIKSTPRCLHRFMNSTPVKEPIKSTISSAPKIEGARVVPCAWKALKDCATPLKTPTKGYVNVVKKHPVKTPSSENRRTCKLETPIRPEASGSKTAGPKWHILSAVSKSFTACKNKLQSPNLSTPFILRTEERAARRKQKLEERFNDKEVQKVQLQTKLKEKAETEFRKLRQSLCFKARPLPNFYKERETSNQPIKKTLQTNPTSRTLGKKAPSKVQGTISSPASMYSSKKNSSNNVRKNNPQTPSRSPSLAEIFNRENASPNILF